MPETFTSVQALVDASGGNVDVTSAYEPLWNLIAELKDKVAERFELTRDPSTEKFETYSGTNEDGTPGPAGTIRGYTGPEIDWMVHSWIANPLASFTNIHLTIWLGPQVRVPHFGMAFGTMPMVWAYMDYVPRADLVADLDYLDTYYSPLNQFAWDRRQTPGLDRFVSHSLHVREALTETATVFSCTDTEKALSVIVPEAHERLDRWLRWVDEAPRVPEEEQAALRARDEIVRRNIAERDPANEMGVRYFGEQMTADLIRSLWGGDRTLPRP